MPSPPSVFFFSYKYENSGNGLKQRELQYYRARFDDLERTGELADFSRLELTLRPGKKKGIWVFSILLP